MTRGDGFRNLHTRSARIRCLKVLRWTAFWIGVSVFCFAAMAPAGQDPAADTSRAIQASTKSPAIVFGFLGGFVAHDNPVHSEVQLAARLRQQYPAGVHVETFASYRAKRARRKILKLLDTDEDGALTPEEKQSAQIILYGHSWGGAEAINVARALQKDGIPVLLTLQVDSISRPGKNDTTIPANVAQAVNFYQPHGLLRGHHDIRAADSARTQILGNYRFDYESSALKCAEYPWYDRLFVKAHTQIECDPIVWDQMESLIRANLPPVTTEESEE